MQFGLLDSSRDFPGRLQVILCCRRSSIKEKVGGVGGVECWMLEEEKNVYPEIYVVCMYRGKYGEKGEK